MAKPMTRHPDTQTIPISFTLNGRLQEIDVEPNELLLDVVRERIDRSRAAVARRPPARVRPRIDNRRPDRHPVRNPVRSRRGHIRVGGARFCQRRLKRPVTRRIDVDLDLGAARFDVLRRGDARVWQREFVLFLN